MGKYLEAEEGFAGHVLWRGDVSRKDPELEFEENNAP